MASPQTFEAGATRQPAESASRAFSSDHSATIESIGFRTGRFRRRPLALAQPRARHHSTVHSPPLPHQPAHSTAAIGHAPFNPFPDHPTSNGHSQSYPSSRAYHLVRRPTQRLPIRVGSNPPATGIAYRPPRIRSRSPQYAFRRLRYTARSHDDSPFAVDGPPRCSAY